MPASRPIRWIVRESREANRTDSHSESPRPHSIGRTSRRTPRVHGRTRPHSIGRTSRRTPHVNRTDFATHPARPRTDSPAFYRTNFARAPARQSDGLTFGIPSPAFPRTDFARIRKADADSTIPQPRYGRNQPPLNHDSTILRVESKNDTISTQPSYFSFLSLAFAAHRVFWYNTRK